VGEGVYCGGVGIDVVEHLAGEAEQGGCLMDQAAERVAALLERMAGALGVTVEHLWPILVARTRVAWWGELFALLVAAVLMGWAAKATLAWFKADGARERGMWDDRMGQGMGLGVVLAGFALSVILLLGHLADVGTAIYPEAATVERLLYAVKCGK